MRIGRRPNASSKTYDNADAIRILDAWWPLLVPAEFKDLGPDLYGALVANLKIDERPGAQGSAFQSGWWGFVQRDLRKVLGDPVQALPAGDVLRWRSTGGVPVGPHRDFAGGNQGAGGDDVPGVRRLCGG